MRLCDVSEIFDCPHSTVPDEGEGYPLIRTPNVGKGRLILDNVHKVSKETYDIRNKRTVPHENDIIFAREAPAGNAAVITKGQNVCLGQRTVLIRPNQSAVNPHYLVYYLLAPQQQIKLLGYSHGATVGHVNIPDLAKLPISLPTLALQKRIADIVENYDNLIEINNKRIKALEQIAENLYKEWFVRFRFLGYENAEFENGIPKGWELKRIGDLVQLKSGYAFKSEWWIEEGVPVIKIKDIESNTINLSDLSFVSKVHAEKSKLFFVNPGDLLIALTGATIGKIGLVPYCKNILTVNQRVGKFFLGKTPCESVAFWFCMFQQTHIQEHIIAIASSNAAQPNISPFDIERIRIPYNKDVVDKFNKKVQPFVEQILDIRRINHNLVKQRDLLLPRLMSGKLEV